jgi:2-oxoglutarate/2-oxoacid ferredoxin oxidoreductase subunit beta
MAHQAVTQLTQKDYKASLQPVWCPGCGDFGVVAAIYQALARLNLDPDHTMLVSGIGCSSRLPGYVNTYSFNAIHGRAIPIATGIKAANPALTVLAVGGDGDGFAIGTQHFVHAARRNVDITYVCMDNSIYGLTKGHVSPTTPTDEVTKTSPYGNIEEPMNPVLMALACGATFIARSFSADVKTSVELIAQAVEHPGFSFVHLISPCPVFRGRQQFDWVKERIRRTPEGFDFTKREQARAIAFEDPREHITLGLIWRDERPSLMAGQQAIRDKATAKGTATYEDVLHSFIPDFGAVGAAR